MSATGASVDDVVLFAGNGTTGAVSLLIHCLDLKKRRQINNGLGLYVFMFQLRCGNIVFFA